MPALEPLDQKTSRQAKGKMCVRFIGQEQEEQVCMAILFTEAMTLGKIKFLFRLKSGENPERD